MTCRMAKADYRRTDRFDTTDTRDTARTSSASSLGTVLGPGDGDDGRRLRAVPTTAAELLVEIERLYRQLDRNTSGSTWRASPAYRALEAQIRDLAARHWLITSGHTITESLKPSVAVPQRGPRPYFRTASEPAPHLTRVW